MPPAAPEYATIGTEKPTAEKSAAAVLENDHGEQKQEVPVAVAAFAGTSPLRKHTRQSEMANAYTQLVGP